MPRISYVSNETYWHAADSDREKLDPLHENIDLCQRDYKRLFAGCGLQSLKVRVAKQHGLIPQNVPIEMCDFSEPEHPDYSDTDYTCEVCGLMLHDHDN